LISAIIIYKDYHLSDVLLSRYSNQSVHRLQWINLSVAAPN